MKFSCKIAALLLSVAMLFSFAGCTLDTDINESSSNFTDSSISESNTADDPPSSGSISTDSDVHSSGSEESEKPNTSTGTGTADPVKLSSIPAFSGNAYAVINDNQPNFSASELTTKAYENYADLDSQGRCGTAIASCGKEIMPADGEERGSFSSIYPSGWKQAKYSGISGGYLWNRCHLIGWQLSAENANRKNLITGTRYMNINGMLPFENMVADYVKETGNHVLYRVTPIFTGDDLVADGVEMEALSMEDDGEGISFHIFAYNNQPGISINYATGDSTLSESSGTMTDQQEYVMNTSSMKFHLPSCSSVSSIKDENKATYQGPREDLIAEGYEPCGRCNP